MKFRLKSAFKPTLDQEKAISKLVRGIEKGVPYQVLLGVTGSGKSLSYGEPVFVFELSNNRCKPKVLPIGELTESLVRKAEQEKTVYLTYSINPKSGKQEIKPIRQFIRHRSPRYMYEVKTTCGRKIIVTGDHNFWVLRNGRLKLIKTKEVKESDYIPIPRKIDIKNTRLKKILLLEWIKRRAYFDASLLSSSNKKLALSLRKDERLALSYLPKLNIERQKLRSIKIGRRIGRETPLVMNITTNLLYFLGLFIAEGHAEKNYSLLSVHEKKLQFLFLKWAKSLNLVPKERKHRPGDFQINYSIWSEVLANWCGARAKEKRLPPWYMELSNRQLSFLLSGYFSGDAGVTKNEIQVASASKRLINDLMYALLRFGIIARVREKPKRATNSNMERAIYYELTISGSENLKFFLQEIGFVLKRKQRKLEDIIREIPNTNVDLVPLWGPDIREIRTALHLSQKTLANLSSCTRSLISLIENNKRNPSRNTLGNILKVFRKRLRIEKSEATTPISFLESLCNAFWTKVRFIKRIKRSSKYVYDIAVENNETFLAGRGGIYVHNTFTVANVIERLGRPTLIISHNKTLAAQLYQELRDFFPENAVSYFVSYYDFYQPEAYIPSTDTYIEKDADINELIDKLRLATTTNLLTRADTIVVASVSCIYNIGSPKEYGNFVFEFAAGMKVAREEIIDRLVDLQYERGDFGFHRGTFRVRGDTIDVYPAYQDAGVRIELTAD
ncbi:MAG: LAGLIDADG family homing endonuclease, partial [Patescibacteria group bacterium]